MPWAVRDLLDAVLDNDVAIGHLQGIRIADVDFLLARPPLAFGVLDRDAGGLQPLADGAHDAFLLGGLQDVIILDIGAGGLQAMEALGSRALVALVEQVELELGRAQGAHLHGRQPRDLFFQHRARAVRHIMMVMVEDVGDDERRILEPRNSPQRRQVRLHDEIAVALVPARRLVAGHRLHIDVVGQQIVAAVRLLVGAFHEVFGLEPLADQPALHVDHGDEHGIDGARADCCLQLREGEVACHMPISSHAPRLRDDRRRRQKLAIARLNDKPRLVAPRRLRGTCGSASVHFVGFGKHGPRSGRCTARRRPRGPVPARPLAPAAVLCLATPAKPHYIDPALPAPDRSLRLSVRTSDFNLKRRVRLP